MGPFPFGFVCPGARLMSDLTPHAARQGGERVLIVPHCHECGDSLRLLLPLSGWHAEVVRGGHAAVRRALEVLPHAVLVDLNLPGEDGWGVGRRLRAGLGSRVRLIGLAPYAWAGDPAGWTEAGFDGWLSKPVDPGPLFDLLGNPVRPAPLDPAWRTADVLALARAAYDERLLPSGELNPVRVAVLADALEEAGCDSAEVLGHLRSPGPHLQGCWAVDLLIGKE
jgi:CheY-like chemotaxis protein